MAYTILELSGDIRAVLNRTEASECYNDLCELVSKALTDQDFISTYLTDRVAGEESREILFEDDKLKFCICGHVYNEQAIGKPHDHGPSWAIYGQAEGTTEMTDWRVVKKGDGHEPSLVEASRTYTMRSGDTKFYGIGHVHSPKRTAPTKILRVEGTNLDHIVRSKVTPTS
jgi:hypothetical protein